MKRFIKQYWWLGCLILMVGIIVIGIGYKESSSRVINHYIRAINEKDYEKVYEVLHKDATVNETNKQSILMYLEDYFQRTQLMKMKKGKRESLEGREYYKVTYGFRESQFESGLSVIKDEEGWRILFPFKVSDVTVHAPLGSTVLLDGKPMEEKADGRYYVDAVLPGEHVIDVTFANAGYKAYQQRITLPKDKEVRVPCEMIAVNMDVPASRIVTFSGKERVSTGEELVFGQVLPGNYTVKVVDPNGVFETQEEVFAIQKDTNKLVFDKSRLSKQGEEAIDTYLEKFYGSYAEGIRTQDTSFLQKYLVPEATQVETLYKEWFIENKKVVDAKMTYEVKELKPIADDLIEIQLVEKVELLNKETDEERAYAILLKSQMVLQPVGKNYLIQSKTIEESMVSYKDADGKWIAY
ncbi:MAG: nuclear transport factor 2 family protein [Cellulosilyticaceae bacterium]